MSDTIRYGIIGSGMMGVEHMLNIRLIPDAVVDFEGGGRALLDLCMFAEASRNEQEIVATGDEGKVECFIPDFQVALGQAAELSAVEGRPVALAELGA